MEDPELGWGWPCECLEYDTPLDLDELVGADAPLSQAALRGRRNADAAGNRNYRTLVCKHWLRGLCMKGERCEFLHVYDPARMPVCHVFATYGECTNKDCIFAHKSVDEKSDECAFYNRGCCNRGTGCKLKHVRRQPCPLYLQGFCPDGPSCQYGHPKFELPDLDSDRNMPDPPMMGRNTAHVTCFKCWRRGHFANSCSNKRIPQPPPHLLQRVQ
ncbi:hypothetical protein T492DRAFT_955001 [Pavlovales sp. CCMP2436]|nr:hypothetical protein T492DRAFT_955001 [Pavlovales sp. CCMP2436]|mmetsp:Transcript_44559/g.110448  ORF Transcript_44559/g.110448 Transcript_44559/m.110448 type:complete len:215 (+) Transcript_44559:95-739(+)